MANPDTFSVSGDTANGVVEPSALHKSLASLVLSVGFAQVETDSDVLRVHYDGSPSAADTIAVGLAVAAHAVDPLKDAKLARDAAINARTDEIIAAGFPYAGKMFSLSIEAQSKMTASYQIREHPAVIYPIRWNTVDDQDAHEVADAAEVVMFYLTAAGTIRAILDSGTALKDAVRVAQTTEAVNAVLDPR